MFIPRRVLFTLLFALAAAPVVNAQFVDPTPDELRMTADPKAPGAAAVFLNIDERTDDVIHYHSFYARIKVLTEKGKELATVHVPYERGEVKVSAIQGRTIHPDGSIVALQGSPSDLLVFRGAGHQLNDMVFTLPSVEVGSILEYYFQILYDNTKVSSPEWIIQQPYFVHKAHYYFIPAYSAGKYVVDKHDRVMGGLMYAPRLPYGGQVIQDSMHRFSLDVTDVPPIPSGDFLPPLNNVVESVVFFYTDDNSLSQFWDTEGKYWAKYVEQFAGTSGPIKKAVDELVAPGDSDDAKARKLYAAVMKINNTGFGRSLEELSSKPNKNAASVLKQQRGSSTDIALLYLALAHAAHLQAWPMQVVNRDRAVFEQNNLNTDQLDDYIVVLHLGGKDVYVDPGEKMCPFGMLHWKHQLTKGFRLSEKGVSIESTPSDPANESAIRRSADLSVDPSGAITGTGQVVLSGQEALRWRQLGLRESEEDLARDFESDLETSMSNGVKGAVESVSNLTDPEGNLTVHIRFSGSLGAVTAKRIILPAFLFEAHGKHPFVEDEKRELPVDLHYTMLEEDQTTYRFPPGMELGELPHEENLHWDDGGIGFSTKFQKSDAALVITRTFIRSTPVLYSSLYSDLRDTYQRISRADQQQIVASRIRTEATAH